MAYVKWMFDGPNSLTRRGGKESRREERGTRVGQRTRKLDRIDQKKRNLQCAFYLPSVKFR